MNAKKASESYDALVRWVRSLRLQRPATVLADPPWRFANRTGKMAPEHRRLSRYETLSFEEIMQLPVGDVVAARAHLYLWVPNALLSFGLETMAAWGFTYKTNLVWYKTRKDGGPDRRGVGFYFRNVTELVLFGIRGKGNRTLPPGRSQANILVSRKREHSRKPDELYRVIEACSPPRYVELFARHSRPGWSSIGNEIDAPRARIHRGYRGDEEMPLLGFESRSSTRRLVGVAG